MHTKRRQLVYLFFVVSMFFQDENNKASNDKYLILFARLFYILLQNMCLT
jgi:hypothetical protein